MFQSLFPLFLACFCLVALLASYHLALGLAAAGAISWLFSRRSGRFLAGLREYAEKLSRRDFDAKVLPVERGYLAGVQVGLESMAFDLKAAFETEARRHHQVETALRGIQDGVLVVDRDGKVLFANPSARLFFQVEQNPLDSAYYWEILREPEIAEMLQRVLVKGGTLTREMAIYRSSERHLLMAATALFDEGQHQPSGAVVLFYDRTEQKKLEKMRSEFAANVSHELRTPLTAIKAALETLEEGALDDPKVSRSFLNKAIHHSERLYELINDVLALASIEEDRRLGRIEPGADAALSEACEDARHALESSLEKHEGTLQVELPQALPPLACDRAALRQVLVNLIENALKYAGPSPKVRVQAREDMASVEVSVMDEGPGIPDGDQNRIFERFYRVDKARARPGSNGGGSGLGLAIVKHLVENYGGQVGVENLPEKGCRFWFRIPRASRQSPLA